MHSKQKTTKIREITFDQRADTSLDTLLALNLAPGSGYWYQHSLGDFAGLDLRAIESVLWSEYGADPLDPVEVLAEARWLYDASKLIRAANWKEA
jgi:hypothetical protein